MDEREVLKAWLLANSKYRLDQIEKILDWYDKRVMN